MSKKPSSSVWRRVRLGDIATERKERANSSEAEVFSITKHDGAVPSLEYFDRKVFSRDTSKYKLMLSGDLAYATIHLDEGSLGIMAKGQQGIVSPMYTVFYVDDSQVLPEFLYKLMKLPQNICRYQRLGEGSIHRRKSIRFNVLSSLVFFVPSVNIQRSILEILKDIEKTIEQTEDVLAKTKQLRDSLLNELLTRGLPGYHTEWKISEELGTIPYAWKIDSLGNIANFVNGRAFRPNEWTTDGLPIVRIQNLTNPKAKFNYFANKVCLDNLIQGGDIIISWSATLKVWTWKGGMAILNQHIFKAISNTLDVSYRFLFHLLRFKLNVLRSKVHGTTMKHITKSSFVATIVPVPPILEQRKIAKILDHIESSVEAYNLELTKLQQLSLSISDTLLSGHRRNTK